MHLALALVDTIMQEYCFKLDFVSDMTNAGVICSEGIILYVYAYSSLQYCIRYEPYLFDM